MANSVIKRTFSGHGGISIKIVVMYVPIIDLTLSHKFHPYSILTGKKRLFYSHICSVLKELNVKTGLFWLFTKRKRVVHSARFYTNRKGIF